MSGFRTPTFDACMAISISLLSSWRINECIAHAGKSLSSAFHEALMAGSEDSDARLSATLFSSSWAASSWTRAAASRSSFNLVWAHPLRNFAPRGAGISSSFWTGA
eukprot:2410831-Pyramimonas_sp.AAC.1